MIGKEKWAEIIRDFLERGVPELVERGLSIPKDTPLKRAITVIGPRRAGKTYSLFQTIQGILGDRIPIERMLYVNFERTDLEGITSKDLASLMETYYEMYPQHKAKKIWLFLDEVQNVEKWEHFVRTVIDHENVQVFISGSSSKFLSKEIATAMRGRTLTYTVLPFSFSEYLTSKKMSIGKFLSSSERSRVLHLLRQYMEKGGYPETVLYPKEGEKVLFDIVETTIYRDLIERYKIRNIKLLKLMIQSIIASAGKEFSVHKFYHYVKSMGMKVSKNTLYNYIDGLHDVFFVFPIHKFSPSYRKAEQSIPKVYLIDNGILTAHGVPDYGRLLENLVFIELMRRGKEVYYYKSIEGKEVDFVCAKNGVAQELVQVAYSLDDFVTKEREIKALVKASKELRCKNLVIISWDKDGIEKVKSPGSKPATIRFVPLWKFLLNA